MKKEFVKVEVKDLYQLLLCNCRYGYTRNNHLMPDSSFTQAERYLQAMVKVDKELASHTAKQLCSECINELESRYYYGNDDEFGNRASYLKFIDALLKFLRKNDVLFNESQIYNIDKYYRNLSEDSRKKYIIYDNATQEELTDVLTRDEYLQFLVDNYTKEDQSKVLLSYRVRDEGPARIYSILRGLEEVVREFKVVNLDLIVQEGAINEQ